jgi:glucose-6-phosphate 1-dehydrogenase
VLKKKISNHSKNKKLYFMQDVGLSITRQDNACIEMPSGPCGYVVFGASGDLAQRKLLPALFKIFQAGLLNERFYLLGAARTALTDLQFRQIVQQSILRKYPDAPQKETDLFTNKLYYIAGNYDDGSFYQKVAAKIAELNKKYKIESGTIFYLAVPQLLYESIVEQLGLAGLSKAYNTDSSRAAKLVVEKPFGSDLQSARRLNSSIHRHFDESQVYRIDHYLGKETVQNILMFRFANAIFEPIWNRNYIDHIQITIAESDGVGYRAGYYDGSGALRDMFQNHTIAMLTLAAMEPPTSFAPESIRDEKIKLIRSIRPLTPEQVGSFFVRGQYTAGLINGIAVPGYRDEPKVNKNSHTETYIAAKLFVDNWRWKDVPFYVRTGKRLSYRETDIAIIFKKVPHCMFSSIDLNCAPANILVMQIQPKEGIQLSFQAKSPGAKTCISTLTMNFSYQDIFGTQAPEAYQRLLLDCMQGDQTLFTRQDAIEASWELLTPVIQKWYNNSSDLHEYPAGADSFPAADNLIESDARQWYSFVKT